MAASVIQKNDEYNETVTALLKLSLWIFLRDSTLLHQDLVIKKPAALVLTKMCYTAALIPKKKECASMNNVNFIQDGSFWRCSRMGGLPSIKIVTYILQS